MFFYHYLKNPKQIGAICQSSKKLSDIITSNISIEKAQNIVEIGAGGGAFTQMILDKKNPDTNFFAIEINPKIATKLTNKIKNLDIEINSANHLTSMMKKRGMQGADIIISGIPWAMLKKKEQQELLEEIYNALHKGGYFATFAYILPTPMAVHFKNKLVNIFGKEKIKTSHIVWQNIPPAFVYYCKK